MFCAYNLRESFLYKPSAGLFDQHFAPRGRTRQRGPAKCLPHAQIASIFWAPKLQIMYLQIIPDVAFVVHVELVVLKQHGHGIGLTERKVEK